MTTRPAPTTLHRFAWFNALVRRLVAVSAARKGPSAVELAHARNAVLTSIGDQTCRDSGMSANDATGYSSHQPDLPFFMQAGFKSGE